MSRSVRPYSRLAPKPPRGTIGKGLIPAARVTQDPQPAYTTVVDVIIRG